ncbi:MAG: polysaccharide biosynthesis/export family protein [Gammaproteobacteria bacterium]|nr:polysaccharide biosynthesis/export family protein [Gammaproteobacteria bacterium]
MNIMIPMVLLTTLLGCSSPGGKLLPNTQPSQSTSYVVGPGDQLQIFVWRNPELSSNVIVRPDGKISSPLITELEVTGLEAPVIGGLIEAELSQYIRTPRVTVIVSSFNSTVNQQIRVIGNATNPMVIPYRAGMTLLDVMIAVQGLSEFADGDNAKLIRKENGVDTAYVIKLDSLINDGDISMNRAVLPGDTIIIPESSF